MLNTTKGIITYIKYSVLIIAVTASFMLFSKNHAFQTDCDLSITGTIISSDDATPLSYVTVGLFNTNKDTVTDDRGQFEITPVCAGTYHLIASLVGYKNLDTLIVLKSNVNIKISLNPDKVNLQEVEVEANKIEKQEVETITKSEISGEALEQTRGESLADAIKEIAGVDVIQTGATIAKPVIHGLYSNRILILNNGIRQEGQQWSSDHAPEIDPFIATKLSVLKGAASIRYGSDAIGGVVLVEPADLPKEKCMNGEINLVGMDNSRLYALSGILQGAFDKKLSGLSYRIQGTFRQAGDIETPHYILDNTGLLEKNYSATLGYEKENYGMTVYYSHFYTELGIFTYSEASNPTEIVELFKQPAPINFPLSYYLTKNESVGLFDFSSKFLNKGFYEINRGYQSVNHNLIKTSTYLKSGSLGKLVATFAYQDDHREEFGLDVPYSINGSLSNAPENNFTLSSGTGELIWEHKSFHNITGSIGTSFITQGNIYTGLDYAPLIPNFVNYGGGLFIMEKWNPTDKFTLEGGVRYDYKLQQEFLLNPTSLVQYTNTQQYDASTATLGAIYRFSDKLSWDANAGNGWRAPSAYELYADGVHASTSQWELGDSTLKVEKSYNFSTSLRYDGKKIETEFGVYANLINNYIYSKPSINPVTDQPDLHGTVEGYYPLFNFTQTNAFFRGADFTLKWHITKHLQYQPKVTLIYANDLTNHDYLVLVPPQRFQNTLEYRWEKLGKYKNVFISIGNLMVPEQTRVPPNSDFVPPPPGYTLFSGSIGCSVPLGRQEMNISIQGNNLLNTVYRDYLDFYRYYAAEPGRSIQLKIRIPFEIIHPKVPKTDL